MTPHYCPVEKTTMMISGCCNWCGAKEQKRFSSVVVNDRLAWVTWAFVILVLIGCVASISYFLGKLL